MPCRLHLPLAVALLAGSLALHAQEAVVGSSDPEALFHSSDWKLNKGKRTHEPRRPPLGLSRLICDSSH